MRKRFVVIVIAGACLVAGFALTRHRHPSRGSKAIRIARTVFVAADGRHLAGFFEGLPRDPRSHLSPPCFPAIVVQMAPALRQLHPLQDRGEARVGAHAVEARVQPEKHDSRPAGVARPLQPVQGALSILQSRIGINESGRSAPGLRGDAFSCPIISCASARPLSRSGFGTSSAVAAAPARFHSGTGAATPASPGAKRKPVSSATVLLVEDHASVRRLCALLLERAGHSVLQ